MAKHVRKLSPSVCSQDEEAPFITEDRRSGKLKDQELLEFDTSKLLDINECLQRYNRTLRFPQPGNRSITYSRMNDQVSRSNEQIRKVLQHAQNVLDREARTIERCAYDHGEKLVGEDGWWLGGDLFGQCRCDIRSTCAES